MAAVIPALDRDRLLADLHAAADDIAWRDGDLNLRLAGMARAWRVVAAAVEDGEYDEEHDEAQETRGAEVAAALAEWWGVRPDPPGSQDVEYAHCPRCGHRHQAPRGYDPLHHGCVACGWQLGDSSGGPVQVIAPAPTEEGGTVETTEQQTSDRETVDLRPLVDLADHLERLARRDRFKGRQAATEGMADWYEGRADGFALAAEWVQEAVKAVRT